MRALITGQVGMDKKPYLNAAREFAGQQGEAFEVYNIGNLMYAEAPEIRPGKILDLPISRLNNLRRAAFKDVISDSVGQENILVNTHATFRWRHGLFAAFDYDQIAKLGIDTFICLVDNIEVVHHRLHADHEIDATLKDCMVWREEEILATELMAKAVEGSRFFILSRGRHDETVRTLFRLLCRPDMKIVYPSFPMSHVMDMPDVLAEIDQFRDALAEHFITFDPGDVDEKVLLDRAIAAAKEGHIEGTLDVTPHTFGGSLGGSLGGPALRAGSEGDSAHRASTPGSENRATIKVRVREVLDIAGDIDGQIYMRDFKLIDQSDMIVSYVPELPGGVPGLSSGVERELQHAFEHTKEVYIVWKPAKTPSPFITETATKVFASVDEALRYFETEGMFGQTNLFGQ